MTVYVFIEYSEYTNWACKNIRAIFKSNRDDSLQCLSVSYILRSGIDRGFTLLLQKYFLNPKYFCIPNVRISHLAPKQFKLLRNIHLYKKVIQFFKRPFFRFTKNISISCDFSLPVQTGDPLKMFPMRSLC